MSLMWREPFTELRRMREDMDRLVENYFQPSAVSSWMAEGVIPAIDVFERDNNIVVKAEVPGLRKEDLDITATEDSISLKGEFKKEEEIKKEGFLRQERQFGRFSRVIPMPSAIKPEEVKASFKDGILEITAPKSAETRERKVNIET